MEKYLNLKTINSFTEFGDSSILVWPSLGKPALLGAPEKFKKGKTITCELIYLTKSNTNEKSLMQEIKNTLYVLPLLGLNPMTRKARIGDAVPLKISNIQFFEVVSLDHSKRIENFLNHESNGKEFGLGAELLPMSPEIQNDFIDRNQSFLVTADFELNEEIIAYLKDHPYLMFNLMQMYPPEIKVPKSFKNHAPSNARIIYHSLCVYRNQDWEDFQFIQASDLHISRRNDEILGVVEKTMNHSMTQKVVGAFNFAKKKITKFAKDDLGIKTLKETEENELSQIPLRERFLNPNNKFREFIKYANAQAQNGNLDFIIFSGDLIDYCMTCHVNPLDTDFDIESTNWKRFLEIVLNEPQAGRDGFPSVGIQDGEELLIPFFTILGNHDYRVGHYSMGSLSIFKHFGLQRVEAMDYRDPHKSLFSVVPSKLCCMAYHQYINPFDDYFLKLGKSVFIFMDSGWDSVQNVQSLLIGGLSLTGFSDSQNNYIHLLGDKVLSSYESGGRLFFVSHAPILNPGLRTTIQKTLRKKFQGLPEIKADHFKERFLRSRDVDDTRSDLDCDYEKGVISNHWMDTVNFIEDNKGIALNGHTHQWREFRTKKSDIPKDINMAEIDFPIYPFAVYWDDYTLQHEDHPERLEDLLPLHLQSSALGFPKESDKLQAGGFRAIHMKNNKIKQCQLFFI